MEQKNKTKSLHAFYFKKNGAAGFTLIELLVVISIIGLLASVILVALDGARLKARDTKRKADIKQIQTALALYYDANNSQYPNCPPWSQSTDPNWNTTGCLITALKPFISALPVDPTNNAPNPWYTGKYSYFYGVSPGLQNYDLGTQLENNNDSEIAKSNNTNFITMEQAQRPGAALPIITAPICTWTINLAPRA